MVWCISWGRQILSAVIHSGAYPGKGACDQVVHKSSALCADAACAVGQEQVVVNQCGTMGNLNKNVLSQSQPIGDLRTFWRNIVVEQVLCDTGSLCLSVKPQTTGAVVEMVAADDHINGSMHFDTADFRTGQVLFVIDMVNMVVLYDREHTA